MSDRGKPSGSQGPRPIVNDGHQPVRIDRGHQPAYAPSKPGAGHQPTGTGAPTPPTTGTGVKPGPAKK